jgi:hypothetical protein
MFGLALVLAFLRPSDCNKGIRTLADGKTDVCTWSKSSYANFVDWLVTWISKDFWLGETMIALVLLTVIATCLSLRQPLAFRPQTDRFGPIAWPALFGSVSLFFAHLFCYYYKLELFGFEFHKFPRSAQILNFVLLTAIALSGWRLQLRVRRFNQEFGDYAISVQSNKLE